MSIQNVIVIGGTGEIGKAVIARLRAEGVRAVCASNDVKQETADEMRVDITDEASVASLFERAEKAVGPISVLINCAGVGVFTSIADTSVQD
ncbi:short subunit dehydrogenase [Archangium gephyra]|uniref:Short subunit dehydrogenase n=1 Tax=Archangium gephyra TaxID=48 RepID=A0ABX9JNS4_9BACT|nr:short subunit dehydrogenase [Archangium gephyra]